MQKAFLFLLFLICGARLYAQQPNYIYIEADKGQPFYVKINDKVQSSSAGGYIIIPGLTEDSYSFNIGFPKNTFPEQRFTINLEKKDKGYQLKNLGEKGWGLFDLQTMALIANNSTLAATDTNQVKKTDAFSTLLSKVVNDPSVLIENKKPVAKAAAESSARDSAETTKIKTVTKPLPQSPQSPQMSPKGDSAANKTSAETKGNSPVKISERQTEDMYEAIYLVDNNDTIRITYPIDKSIMTAPPATPLTDNKEAEVRDTLRGSIADNREPEKPVLKITNSDCRSFASDQDVDKLRVKILSQGDIDNKLSVAKKYFRTKCFTVKQVRALAELFAQDETKYQLFDIAYPFISDTENFYQLEDNLENEYYKNRFRAMIKK